MSVWKPTKCCRNCKIEKDKSLFQFEPSGKLSRTCEDCRKHSLVGSRKCKGCRGSFPTESFVITGKTPEGKDVRASKCPACYMNRATFAEKRRVIKKDKIKQCIRCGSDMVNVGRKQICCPAKTPNPKKEKPLVYTCALPPKVRSVTPKIRKEKPIVYTCELPPGFRRKRSELKCRKCGEQRSRSFFQISTNGHNQTCDLCRSAAKKTREKKPPISKTKSTCKCRRCQEELPKEKFEMGSRICRPCKDNEVAKPKVAYKKGLEELQEYMSRPKPKKFVPSQPTQKPYLTCKRCWSTKKAEQFIDSVCVSCVKIIKEKR